MPQIRLGIRVSLAYYANCEHYGETNNIKDLDFGLFDDFAVSYFRWEEGRSYKISIAPDECKKRLELYNKILRKCEDVPEKSGPNKKVFETEAEFLKWVESVGRS